MGASEKSWARMLLGDWQRRLSILLIGIYLLQFVEWIAKEKHVWLPETITIVKLTLLLTFVIEIIPRIHWVIRSLLQLIAIIAANHYVLTGIGHIPKVGLPTYLSGRFMENIVMLIPYLWFALGAWVVYLAAIWWVEAKWRIYAMIVISILALCIRDSFSSIFLWPQVAVMLFCGLFLLIISHFQQLKKKDPSAYGYLTEYPASIATPVVLLVSLTIIVGALMPEIGPLMTDPYTAWRNLRGQPASFTTGKGIEVAVSPADTSSGYSRSDQALGGSFNFDYTPVMTVDTTHRSYWRGETRSFYNGKGWEMSEAERRAALTGVRTGQTLAPDPKMAGSQLKTVEVKQTVTMMDEQTYPVLFGSLFMQKVESVDTSGGGMERFLWSPQHDELRFNEQSRQPYPKTYTIVSQMPIIDEEGLRKAPAELPNRNEFADYLQLPDRLPERVRTLAADLTKDATNPFDKARIIEEYLRLTFPYTNKPDVSKGRSRDFVDRFLFEIKEGYCDYYSTSMAIMLRTLGIPTRWVKGYASGVLPTDETELLGLDPSMVDPDAGGIYTVRNADAHSWVEAYFAGWGWIPFEPTSGFVLPRAVQAPELPVDLSTIPTVTEPEPESALPASEHITSYGGIIAALLILVYAAYRFEWLSVLQERLKQRRAHLFKQKVIVECEKLLRIFRRKGYTRHEHETVREAVQRWSKQSKWMKADLEQILNAFEKAKYSKAEVTEQDWQNTVQSVQKLRSQL
ncbi:transglutaminase TgpA family protein [Paenibacillus hamazuiensis]|uniref:transglutaminase TgpA family protein n=1 Tax=Paenibacillus hamazuiensis TaxID=2936508 RepID=UPI00200F36E7|nr:transglutaminaseTgpA domain-containing protein [Paenibacillus hamazuiensis]